MFEKVSADELAAMQTLARRTRSELAAAGLPVPAPGLGPVLAGGAEVEIDDGADPGGGVFVSWTASPRLQECTSRALRLRQLDDPLLRHSAEIKAAMMQAMTVILLSAGFTVQDAADGYRPYQLRVVNGPSRTCRPYGRFVTTKWPWPPGRQATRTKAAADPAITPQQTPHNSQAICYGTRVLNQKSVLVAKSASLRTSRQVLPPPRRSAPGGGSPCRPAQVAWLTEGHACSIRRASTRTRL